jgi:hypothetical protein
VTAAEGPRTSRLTTAKTTGARAGEGNVSAALAARTARLGRRALRRRNLVRRRLRLRDVHRRLAQHWR